MRDEQTNTIWNHLDGLATKGPLEGHRLSLIPLQQTTWGAWLKENPRTTTLSMETDYKEHYQRHIKIGQFKTDEANFGDKRMPSNQLILGIEINNNHRAYPLDKLQESGGVVNEKFQAHHIVAAFDHLTGNAMAYMATINGVQIEFELFREDGRVFLKDRKSPSLWTMGGHPISGPLAKTNLKFVPSIISEWYGWSAYHPLTSIYSKSN